MDRSQLIDLIFSLSEARAGFEALETRFSKISKTKLLSTILESGIMPEVFNHDSTEEKLWAKYSDILLSKSLECFGLKSQVIRVRGDSADVLAESPKYKIVGDAKTFRLSRTAKNQKDFKVEALDSWRRANDYAVLVGPFCHYPKAASAIYRQAITKNVTLLAYSHLYFMLKHYKPGIDLKPLWCVGSTKQSQMADSKSANVYWNLIETMLLKLFKKHPDDLEKVKRQDVATTHQLGKEGIEYWENKINEYKKLTKEEAIRRLLKAEKIEAKIEQIKKTIAKEAVVT